MDPIIDCVNITENLASIPGPSTGGSTQSPNESAAGVATKKRRNLKNKIGNEKAKVKNVEAESLSTTSSIAGAPQSRNESTTSVMSKKRTRNANVNSGNEKSKVKNDEAESLAATPGSSAEEINEIQVSNESTTDFETKKTSNPRNAIDNSGNEKSKAKSVEAKNLKDVPPPETKNMKRKAPHPPTSEMVMDSIKALEKRKGATFEDIKKHMEEKYTVNMKMLKRHVDNFLKKSVDDGLLEKTSGVGVEERFKTKKSENIKKSSQNLRGKDKEKKQVKKFIVTKKRGRK